MDLMIDLETLATTPDATILTIGALGFDPFTDDIGDDFYERITLSSQENRVIDNSTVDWWSKQNEEAQDEAFGDDGDRIDLDLMLTKLAHLASRHKRIWANGILFDIGILENAYFSYNMPLPWKYFNIVDARSIIKIYPKVGKLQNSHHALEDCINQIDMIRRIFKELDITSF